MDENKEEAATFDNEICHRFFVDERMKKLFEVFPRSAHTMAMLSSAVSALLAFCFVHLKIDNEAEYDAMAKRIIAKMPTLVAFAYRHNLGIPIIYPDIDRYFTENFLYMMRAYPGGKFHKEPGKKAPTTIKEVEVRALDTIFSLHADHKQNASTTTVRSVASTAAHPYAAISAGIDALRGRAHGGANESIIAQLELIGDVKNIDFYSGVILTALGIPKNMFTPIFVIGRTVGWITQWIEFKKDKNSKIARPRQLYTGK